MMEEIEEMTKAQSDRLFGLALAAAIDVIGPIYPDERLDDDGESEKRIALSVVKAAAAAQRMVELCRVENGPGVYTWLPFGSSALVASAMWICIMHAPEIEDHKCSGKHTYALVIENGFSAFNFGGIAINGLARGLLAINNIGNAYFSLYGDEYSHDVEEDIFCVLEGGN